MSTDFAVETKRFLSYINNFVLMKVSIDTKEDSHEEIKKLIRMLQNLVGDSQEIFSNQPVASDSGAAAVSPFDNIFGDASAAPSAPTQETPAASADESKEETSESTEDLFAELFSEEELKKMGKTEESEEEEETEEEAKPKDKKHDIELY